MAFWNKRSDPDPFKSRQDEGPGPVHGGTIGEETKGKDPARGVPGAIVSAGGALTAERSRLVDQALTHPSVSAPVFFFATEFGRMPYVLEQEGEPAEGAAPSWMKRPLPKNPAYVWKRFQTSVGFELELFGEVGLRVVQEGTALGGEPDITSIRPISARRFVTLGDVGDPSYIVYPETQAINEGGRVRRVKSKDNYEELTTEPNNDGVFFLHLTTMTDAYGSIGLSPYTLAGSTVYDAGYSRLQKSRFWQRDGRKLWGAKNIDPKRSFTEDEWNKVIKRYKQAVQVNPDDPSAVPLFAKELEVFDLDDTMKNAQGVEFAEFWSSQLAMLGRIPEMLIRMSHKSNPNYKIIRAIYQFYVANRIAPALEDFAGVLQTLLPEEIRLRFDLTDALRADLETLIATFRNGRGIPVFTGNKMLELLGFPKSEDPQMDKHFVDIQTIPVELVEEFARSMIEKNEGLGAKSAARAASYGPSGG